MCINQLVNESRLLAAAISGAGTNLKVGEGAKSGSCPSTFSALKAQLVVLVSAFVMVSTVWSASCLLSFYSQCPPCPAICKSGGHMPPCPMESAPLAATRNIRTQTSVSAAPAFHVTHMTSWWKSSVVSRVQRDLLDARKVVNSRWNVSFQLHQSNVVFPHVFRTQNTTQHVLDNVTLLTDLSCCLTVDLPISHVTSCVFETYSKE